MRVLLVGNYRADRNFSMLGFEECLKLRLPKLGVQAEAVFPKPVLGGKGRSPKADKWLGYIDKFVLFPRELKKRASGFDLVHVCDQGDAIWLKSLRDRRHLITCHDMLPIRAAKGEIEGWSVGRTGRVLQNAIFENLSKAQNVAFASQATADDYHRLTGRTKGTTVVLNGMYRDVYHVDPAAAMAQLEGVLPNASERFVFHLGGNQHYKNRVGLIRIYRELVKQLGSECPRLVLAGIPPAPEILAEAGELLGQGLVVPVQLPTDEQIAALYSLADALIFPSLFEGFGLPILEAQACRCPVFTSNRAPMTEAGGEAAVYFDPDGAAGAASVIAANWGRREEMARLGMASAPGWTPDAMVERYVRAYGSLA